VPALSDYDVNSSRDDLFSACRPYVMIERSANVGIVVAQEVARAQAHNVKRNTVYEV
jgi:hypothetical protein